MNDCNFDILKENIRKRMSDKHMTQKDVAKALNTTQANIAKHLKKGDDAQTFTLKQVCLLADLFETSIDELLGNTRKGDKDSIEDICKFLGRLITRQIITPTKINVQESIWVEDEYASGEESGYSQRNGIVSKYIALYFPNYEQIEDNLEGPPLEDKLFEFRMCGNCMPNGIEVNKFLNKFLSTLSKYNKGILDEEEYEAIIKTYLKALKKPRS